MLDCQQQIYGRYPLKVALDGGFASKDNLLKAKERKIKAVCFEARFERNGHVPQRVRVQKTQVLSRRDQGRNILAQAQFRFDPLHRMAVCPQCEKD